MGNIETFHNKKNIAAEAVGFRFAADLFTSVRFIVGFCCHGQRRDASRYEMVAAETVGFRIEADLFKAVPMILGFGCHGQH